VPFTSDLVSGSQDLSALDGPALVQRLEAWMRHTRPITFGERLSVCFACSEHDRGDRSRLIELGPGATVGELAVLVPAPRAASVTALEPTLVLRVDQAVLDELLVDWPELAQGVIAELVSRLRATTEFADQAS
jgi:CRP-like cAMP-binding protein